MGSRRSKLWTILIFGVLLVVGILVANFALAHPDAAREGLEAFAGLPKWAFPSILAVVGAFLFWIGLKIEADWPEMMGAAMIAGGAFWGELMIGLDTFIIGGFVVLPYLIPAAIFIVLMIVAMVKSR